MTEDDFWEIVESCRAASGGDFEEQVWLQRERLLALTVDELASFTALWETVDNRAFTWPVWDAAALVFGNPEDFDVDPWAMRFDPERYGDKGFNDDAFADFRAWLIGQGRLAFERVVDDPDNFADLLDEWNCESGGHAEEYASQVYEVYEERTDAGVALSTAEPSGESVDVENEQIARSRFPRLAGYRYLGDD
ncbi:DUF4240 domain-containing protein [Nonomuraea sp. NPDC049141]|uniref:DUF4240 domain-containing protein n=1 Tax=unclassified Nonomuraea TaxID=2593643 RepID=UPI0033C76F66